MIFRSRVIFVMCAFGVTFGTLLLAVLLYTSEPVMDEMAGMEVEGAAGVADEFAGEYESAVRGAAAAQAADEDWMAAVAHGRAGGAAGDAADEWADASLNIEFYTKYGGDAAAEAWKTAASAEAGWRAMEAGAFKLAAGAAADAGRERAAAALARNAADAQDRVDELYYGMLVFAVDPSAAGEAVHMPAEYRLRP